MKLKERIEDFYAEIHKEGINDVTLSNAFKKLAPSFIYGGYIDVNGVYRIYIRTVEFYFHDENGLVTDPIVYHRNGRLDDIKEVPNFPFISLHAHASGFDIAFERGSFRASALIRKYVVMYKTGDTFQPLIRLKKLSGEDDRSTFLYDIINGFSLEKECQKRIEWVDVNYSETEDDLQKPTVRRNVFKFDKNPDYSYGQPDYIRRKPKEKDTREWSFSAAKQFNVSK